MSLPANLTHAEIGAMLMAVGTAMIVQNVCAGAAQDGGSDDLLRESLQHHGLVGERADELLRMDLQQALEFVDVGGA